MCLSITTMPCSVSAICSDNGKRGLIVEYGNGLYIKRDDKTIKSIAVLYRYIDTLPLTRNQRVQILGLIGAALTNAENNGYFVGTDAVSIFRAKLKEVGIDTQQ